ncbi:MAG TPA: phosphoribosyltransferase [Nitrolancea sp.]|nr:phosphoribosyltransferase [Nitrolancea sp.]
MPVPFQNRFDAGRQLAQKLLEYVDMPTTDVLGLPRGGVPVAYEVAIQLNQPLDVFLVRKLGVPDHEELAMGAVASGGVRVLNQSVIYGLDISEEAIDDETRRELAVIQQRERDYRGDQPPLRINGRTIILIDDGLATGSTMLAAVAALRQKNPAKIVVGVPVASREACREVGSHVDQIVCLATPEPFYAVGQWYLEFGETSDAEVRDLLRRARRRAGVWTPPPEEDLPRTG